VYDGATSSKDPQRLTWTEKLTERLLIVHGEGRSWVEWGWGVGTDKELSIAQRELCILLH